LNVEYSQKR